MPLDTQEIDFKESLDIPPSPALDASASYVASFSYKSAGKRVFDTLLILLSAPIVIPIILCMALLTCLDGHSPFYTQLRVGRNGKTFRILKIRTMVHNADSLLAGYLEKNARKKAEWDATQKLKNDIRITPVGRFLRKTSLDELPQLYNVLTGSMSLVGPRPMMVSQQAIYPGTSYYTVRPGITGLWQVSDRNECDFGKRAVYDGQYARNVSLFLDLHILMKTVQVVLRGTGH